MMLQHELGRLVGAEIIYQRGVPPQATYTFKHALIQDAAYESLLKSTRQHYHQRIAQVSSRVPMADWVPPSPSWETSLLPALIWSKHSASIMPSHSALPVPHKTLESPGSVFWRGLWSRSAILTMP
jgi:hypothetical protein